MTLTSTFQELIEFNRESDWRRLGIPETDIVFSRLAGIDARDCKTFREITRTNLLIVIRCPRVTARPWHGVFPPKNWATKEKSGSSGVVVREKDGRIFVSDYDLMSLWRRNGAGMQKIVASAAGGASRGSYPVEAAQLFREINKKLVSRIQHGCQDDFDSVKNPGVKPGDHFAAFSRGTARHLGGPQQCAEYYRQNELYWPYDMAGRYLSSHP